MTTGSSNKAYTPSRPSQRPVSPWPVLYQTRKRIVGATVLNRWGEYCSDLYNYPLYPDSSLLQNDPRPEADYESLPILKVVQL
ncbi:hypothetical protein DPMN_066279 [Dreissena polymorpha]|uniref:Uncharacterized protein n=1 Tax=Dreissena polymorpha TaxID=45954 RepID=A0A9D3YTQ7_DREPO|nr:hypothetical protein DPMN_066279 [Dreissena polymorpha]